MTSPLRAPQPQRAPEPRRSSHPKPYLRVAPEPYRRRRTAVAVAGVVVVVFGSLLASAVFQSALVSGQLRLDDVQRRTERTRLVVARDQVRLAELQSPARLEAAAARQGMVPATKSYAVGPGPDAPVATGVSPAEAPADATTTTATTMPSVPAGRERAATGPKGPVR